tara:strand:+ start:566 stop:805 length:240 start_codon:yes stop_codon:yes gene_type:complete
MGNKKLIKKIKPQKIKANIEFVLFRLANVFDLKPLFVGEWYCAFFLEIFSIINNPKINIKRKNDNLFAKDRSSKAIHAL